MTQEYAYGMWVIAVFIPPVAQWKAFLLTEVPYI